MVRMFVLLKSQKSLKMGHVGSKTRSLGQILEKHCIHCRGHILSLIVMKHGQNVCLNIFWTNMEIDHVGSKTRSLGHILEKLYVCSRGHIFSPIIMKVGQNVCYDNLRHA